MGHELLSSRERWSLSGFVLQLQAVWAAGTGSQMSEMPKGQSDTPWVLGPKGIWAAAKGQESSREVVTPRECSWPTRLGRWAGPTPRAAPAPQGFNQSCPTMARTVGGSRLSPGAHRGSDRRPFMGVPHSQLLGWLWLPELCPWQGWGWTGWDSFPPQSPGLRLQLENIRPGRE